MMGVQHIIYSMTRALQILQKDLSPLLCINSNFSALFHETLGIETYFPAAGGSEAQAMPLETESSLQQVKHLPQLQPFSITCVAICAKD